MDETKDLELEIEEGFRRFGKQVARASMVFEGIIKEVDETAFTCVVEVITNNPDGSETNVPFSNVFLKVLKGSQASFIEIPSLSTESEPNYCLICFRDNNIQRPQLFSVHKIDKLLIVIGEQKLSISTDGFVFNNGTNPMPKSDIVDKVITLEKSINDLKTAFTNWVVVPSDGGAALKTITADWYANQLTVTEKKDVVNEKIKQ